jgi:hypothetical protein
MIFLVCKNMVQIHKFHYLKKIVAPLILMLLFAACSRSKYPDNLTMIPANASLVACIDVKQLIDKSALSSFKSSRTVALMSQSALDGSPMLKALIDDPTKSGIDFKTMYVFLLNPRQVGITFPLRSASTFERAILSLEKEEQHPVTIQTASSCKYIFFLEQDSTVLVWNHHKALAMMHSTPQNACSVFATAQDHSIITNKDFEQFYQQRGDVACWAVLRKLTHWEFLKGRSSAMPAFTSEYVHANLFFEKGSIKGKIDFSPQNAFTRDQQTLVKQTKDTSLITYMPAASYLMAKVSVRPEAVFPYLPSFSGSSSSYDKLVHAWSGDAAFSFFGFANDGFPVPQMALVATLQNQKGYDALLNGLLKQFPKRNTDGYTLITIQPFLLYAALEGHTLMVTTDKVLISEFAAHRVPEHHVEPSAWNGDARDPLFLYVNLDLQNYPEGLIEFADSFSDGMLDAVKQDLIFKDLKASYDPSINKASFELRLKDTTQNSLHVLLQKVDEAVAATN